MATIKDVAREAGVSTATVSYVLNEKKRSLISASTREHVLEAIRRTGYTPNTAARNLKASQSHLIGYAWHKMPVGSVNPLLDNFTYSLAQAVEYAGYHLLTFTHPARGPVPVYDEMIRSGRVDAFVLSDTRRDDARIRFLMECDFPFVSFGQSNEEWDFPWVDTDGQNGMEQAVNHLIQLGHEQIAMAAWPEDSISGNARVDGYLAAMQRANLPIPEGYIQRGEQSEDAGRRACAAWLRLPKHKRPTAVAAITDLVAIGVMNEAAANGLVIGQDLSVVGFDNTPLGQYLHPALTTVQQGIPEIAQALLTMLQAILNKDTSVPRQVLIAPELIVRASCGKPNR